MSARIINYDRFNTHQKWNTV